MAQFFYKSRIKTILMCLNIKKTKVPKFIWFKILNYNYLPKKKIKGPKRYYIVKKIVPEEVENSYLFEFNLEICKHLTPNNILVGACGIGNSYLAHECLQKLYVKKKNKGIIAAIKNNHFGLAAEVVEKCRNISIRTINIALHKAPSKLVHLIIKKAHVLPRPIYRYILEPKDNLVEFFSENFCSSEFYCYLIREQCEAGNTKILEPIFKSIRYFPFEAIEWIISHGRIGVLKLALKRCKDKSIQKIYDLAKSYDKLYICKYLKKKYPFLKI